MDYLRRKIIDTCDSLLVSTIDYLFRRISYNFRTELIFNVGDMSDAQIISVLQQIDTNMNSGKLKPNSYFDENNMIHLHPYAHYFILFSKSCTIMEVKAEAYPDLAEIRNIHVIFYGKESRKLSKIFLNQIRHNARKGSAAINCIKVSEMIKKDDSLMWSNAFDVPTKQSEEIFITAENRELLFGYLNKFQKAQNLFAKIDISYKVGILLYGPPGTGKSTISKIIAKELKCPLYIVNMAFFNSEAIELIKNRTDNFLKIILFEDIDYIFGKRENDRTPEEKANANSFLQLLDGVTSISNTIFIATTNGIASLDNALIRDGRFDLKIEMNNISRSLATDLIKNIGITSSEAIDHILQENTDTFNPAHIQNRTIQYIFKNIENIDAFCQ